MSDPRAFTLATDRLAAAGVPLVELARELGVAPASLSRMRRGPDEQARRHRNTLSPPDDWGSAVAAVARRGLEAKAREMEELRALIQDLSRREAAEPVHAG